MLVSQGAHLGEAMFLATIEINAIGWYFNQTARLVSHATQPNQ